MSRVSIPTSRSLGPQSVILCHIRFTSTSISGGLSDPNPGISGGVSPGISDPPTLVPGGSPGVEGGSAGERAASMESRMPENSLASRATRRLFAFLCSCRCFSVSVDSGTLPPKGTPPADMPLARGGTIGGVERGAVPSWSVSGLSRARE
eukprot:CAMPEP_0170197200 /NCGR_PEP_ID=MMETSP0040_2-20121228/65820_1 /TAXON_ID=641309 /ORGANISM="Lotharella oceanica, Strain CCMP622" /LENGTH=149 /DNA_ID=CAMNT_0010446825 /DNA_START=51 /DNA_END=500 /DNA_ORIENTATION=-